jgi:hypothetical protein
LIVAGDFLGNGRQQVVLYDRNAGKAEVVGFDASGEKTWTLRTAAWAIRGTRSSPAISWESSTRGGKKKRLHRGIKGRCRPMLGLKSTASATSSDTSFAADLGCVNMLLLQHGAGSTCGKR